MESEHILDRIKFMQDQYILLKEQLHYGSAFFDEHIKTSIAELKGNFDNVIEGFKEQLKDTLLEEALKTLEKK